MTKTNKKGTSLVELLAVIVIMGIIAAIAVPTVGALLKNTRKKAAASDVLTLVQSVDTFLAGADATDKTTIGVSGGSFTLSKTDTTKVAAIFDEDKATIDATAGTITFTLNSAGTKVSTVSFSEDFTYTKSGKTYSGFSFADGAVKCSTEA